MESLTLKKILSNSITNKPSLDPLNRDINTTTLHISALQKKIIVVKYGGNAMTDETLQQQFAFDIAFLKTLGIKIVVVHGGGPQIDNMLERVGKKSSFIQGMRVTDAETMDIVEGVLAGNVQGQIVGLINQSGLEHNVRAVGISGKDGRMVQVKKLYLPDLHNASIQHDIGQVGDVLTINTSLVDTLLNADFIPVVSPITCDDTNTSYNVNADVIASELACALKAEKLMLLTNIKGVLDKSNELIPSLNKITIQALINDGTLYGGMLPKIDSALNAAQRGVSAVHILDGRVAHGLLLALLSDTAVGTTITI